MVPRVFDVRFPLVEYGMYGWYYWCFLGSLRSRAGANSVVVIEIKRGIEVVFHASTRDALLRDCDEYIRCCASKFKNDVYVLASSSNVKPRNNFGWKKGSSGSVTSFFSKRGCFAAEAIEEPKEGLGIGVKSNFLEDPRVVGGVKGVRMLREEASPD
jgi:hypothetical protein